MARRSATRWAGSIGFAAVLVARAAAAEPIPSNDYSIDLYQGPLLAPIRVSGIAGAYAGVAEGISAMVVNSAAPAVREPSSVNYVELDLDGSISIPLSLTKNDDFDNSGTADADYSNFVYLTAGALAQVGALGVGAIGELQLYQIDGEQGSTDVAVGKYRALGAFRVFGDQLVIGGGVRIASLTLGAPEANLAIVGAAPEFGFLVRPDWQPFRIGATFRAPVDAGAFLDQRRSVDRNGLERAGGLVVPNAVVLPWEIEIGTALQVGPKPLNPEWENPREQEAVVAANLARVKRERRIARDAELATIDDPVLRGKKAAEFQRLELSEAAADVRRLERESERLESARRARYWNWPRDHLLLTAELLVTGAVHNGVSLEAFLGQNERRPLRGRTFRGPPIIGSSGDAVSFSPRFGIETEPVSMLIKTRFGSYYEPSRFRDIGRQHFTFGADLRLFSTRWWGLVSEVIYKLQASVDIAPRYESYSLGIGVWR